jgi:hypothetical protein
MGKGSRSTKSKKNKQAQKKTQILHLDFKLKNAKVYSTPKTLSSTVRANTILDSIQSKSTFLRKGKGRIEGNETDFGGVERNVLLNCTPSIERLDRIVPTHSFTQGFHRRRQDTGPKVDTIRDEFQNEYNSLQQRELAKRKTSQQQHRKGSKGKGSLQFKAATFRIGRESDKSTSQLLRETVEEMGEIALSSSSSSMVLHPKVVTTCRTRSLDEMLSLYDDENDMECVDNDEKKTYGQANRSFAKLKSADDTTNRYSMSSAQFRRQRMFQLQQRDEGVGGSNISSVESLTGSLCLSIPDSPHMLERSILRRSTENFPDGNIFALLDDDNDDGMLNASHSKELNRSSRSNSNPFVQFQPASFDLSNMGHSSISSGASGNDRRLSEAFSNVIIEAENEDDDL